MMTMIMATDARLSASSSADTQSPSMCHKWLIVAAAKLAGSAKIGEYNDDDDNDDSNWIVQISVVANFDVPELETEYECVTYRQCPNRSTSSSSRHERS